MFPLDCKLSPKNVIHCWRIEKPESFPVTHGYQDKSKTNKKIHCVFTANGNAISLRHPIKCLIIVVQGSQVKGV